MLDTSRVRQLAARQNIGSAYQLWKAITEAGYETSESQVRRLWEGQPDPKQSTMDMLCAVLKCEQSALLVRLNGRHGSAKTARGR